MNSERRGTLVVLACHGVYDPECNAFHAEHPDDRPVYEAQLAYAFKHLVWRAAASPLLVISGGLTKIERRCSESRSYLDLAHTLGLAIPENIALEEHALTSIENLLFSLYVYHQVRNTYPANVEVISWEFKRSRFEQTLAAINHWSPLGQQWPTLGYFPVGDLWGTAKARSLAVEDGYTTSLRNGIDAYYQNPQTRELLARRDAYQSRASVREAHAGYPMPF